MATRSIMARSRGTYFEEGDGSSGYIEEDDALLRLPPRTPTNESPNPESTMSEDTTASPRTLYASTFERPSFTTQVSPSLPSALTYDSKRPRTKNIQKMIGEVTEEEFDALPLAVRRKYFSSLERLRFAQSSVYNELGVPVQRKPSLADRRGVRSPLVDSSRTYFGSKTTRRSRKPIRKATDATSTEVSWFLTFPNKNKTDNIEGQQRHLTPQRPRKAFVLYDAADQNVHKATKKTRTVLSSGSSMESIENEPTQQIEPTETRQTSMTRDIIDSFRWMDEEEDLDLRLVLDDYHANVDGAVIPLPNSIHPHRPSFRRHMSISQTPFGRTSFSSLNTSPRTERQSHHGRTKSRTVSLMGARHGAKNSVSSIDAHATHYQDPEARLKLRVYLASPQKFDEAIEFGFPSLETSPEVVEKEDKSSRKNSREMDASKSPDLINDSIQTFLNDDTVSLSSNDDISMNDPDSPLTPAEAEGDFKHEATRLSFNGKRSMSPSHDHMHAGPRRAFLHRPADSLAQQLAGSREMTLRMTLTRPDLRADETQLYGWQEKDKPRAKSPLIEEPSVLEAPFVEKYDKLGPFGGLDGWGPMDKEDGVVKRFWNRVKSTQRKAS